MPGSMRIQEYLSSGDTEPIKEIGAIIKSNKGEYLTTVDECEKEMDVLAEDLNMGIDKSVAQYDESVNLVEANADGSLPENAIFQISDAKCWLMNHPFPGSLAKKISAAFSEFFRPSQSGETRVQIRSPVAGVPPHGQLRVVSSNKEGSGKRKKVGGEFCLVACDNGTVKWLHQSECVTGNHIWTVRLFEHCVGGALHLRDKLRRTEPKVYNNCVINNTGGNVNVSGTQKIGHVCQH